MPRLRLLLLVSLAACPSSSGSDDWVPSDIDESQTLDRLGAAGYQRLCGAFDDYVRDQYRSSYLIQAACTAHALQTTADAVACGQAVDACLDDLPPAVESALDMILDQAGCSAAGVSATGCASPVSALTDCLDALGSQLDQIQFSLTCAAFGSPVPQDWWRISPPSACTAIASGC
jgi:hypothetical protein